MVKEKEGLVVLLIWLAGLIKHSNSMHKIDTHTHTYMYAHALSYQHCSLVRGKATIGELLICSKVYFCWNCDLGLLME